MKRWRSRLAGCLGVAVLLGCTAAPTSTSTVSTPVRLLTNAYIMDGTGWPTPSPGFVESVIKEFIVPLLPGSYTGIPLTTPEQTVGISQSVAGGVANLEAATAQQEEMHPGQPFVVFGYSQSTMIILAEKARLEEKKARGEPVPDVTFVGIGGLDWPNGSITSRLPGLVVPVIDFTLSVPAPSDPANAITSIQIARQYDGFVDAAQFVSNPVAVANSLLGAIFVHGLYGQEVSLDPDSPKYVPGTIRQQDGKTTYYWIPTADLPLFDPLRLMGMPEALIDIVEPFAKVLVDAGYDRTVPFSKPTPAQLIPVIDPVTLTIQLAAAVLEGVDNGVRILGGELPGYAPLAEQLATAQSSSAAVIGAPYRDMVIGINDAVNPIETFIRFEAPIAETINSVTNGLGVPNLLNGVIDPTLFPVSAWAERNILTPLPNTDPGPLATVARQFLQRVAPNLDAGTPANVEVATSPKPTAASEQGSLRSFTPARVGHAGTASHDSPKPAKPTTGKSVAGSDTSGGPLGAATSSGASDQPGKGAAGSSGAASSDAASAP